MCVCLSVYIYIHTYMERAFKNYPLCSLQAYNTSLQTVAGRDRRSPELLLSKGNHSANIYPSPALSWP